MSRKEKIAIFTPLAVFLVYAIHLAFLSTRPFLLRWIEGCFGFFLALVFCNIIRRNIIIRTEEPDGVSPPGKPVPPQD